MRICGRDSGNPGGRSPQYPGGPVQGAAPPGGRWWRGVSPRRMVAWGAGLRMVLLFLGPVLAAPQYGGAPAQQQPRPVQQAPFVQQAAAVQCTTTYQEVWDTQYIQKTEKSCQTVSETLYRQACSTVYKQQCSTVQEQVCSQQYRQESQPYTETECNTQYKQDCEARWETDGYGGKKWVDVPSTCNNNAYDTCRDVQKQKLVQVPYNDCRNVPKQKCQKVPQQECRQEAYQAPKQVCEDVHRKIPQRVSRRVPKKTCGGSGSLTSGSSSGSSYGSSGSSGSSSGFSSGSSSGSSHGSSGQQSVGSVLRDTQEQPRPSNRNNDAINFG